MRERIKNIWNNLSSQSSSGHEMIKTLYDTKLNLSIFISVIFPDKNKSLLFGVPKLHSELPESFVRKGIKVDVIESKDQLVNHYVRLTLTDNKYENVFSVLIEDCIKIVSENGSAKTCYQAFIERLSLWKSMLDYYVVKGLGEKEQIGLFGELVVLLRLLKQFTMQRLQIINAWQGPDKFRQDYQANDWGIEVKSTTDGNEIEIANKYQLDTSDLKMLFLWLLIFERTAGYGATINHLIKEIKETISDNSCALDLFNTRLAASGYYEHQSGLYNANGYFIRQESIYHVKFPFPALTTGNLPADVTDAKYKINISGCSSFIVSESSIYSSINF